MEDYVVAETNLNIAEEFNGDYIRNNDGLHQNGGIQDDEKWQKRFRSLVELPLQLYDLPNR